MSSRVPYYAQQDAARATIEKLSKRRMSAEAARQRMQAFHLKLMMGVAVVFVIALGFGAYNATLESDAQAKTKLEANAQRGEQARINSVRMPGSGSDCQERRFDNRTGILIAENSVKCDDEEPSPAAMSAAAAMAGRPDASPVSRAAGISAGFKKFNR